MKKIESVNELLAVDSDLAFPDRGWTKDEESALRHSVERIAVRLLKFAKIDLVVEGPDAFQDGPVFMCLSEKTSSSEVCGGLCFSAFGRLFCGGRVDDRSGASEETWRTLIEVVSEDYGWVYVPDSLLKLEYSGPFKAYRVRTWNERFFSPWYSHSQRGKKR